MNGIVEDGRKTRLNMGLRMALTDIVTLFTVITTVTLVRFICGGGFSLATYAALLPIVGLFPIVFALADLYPGTLMPPHEELKRFCITVTGCFLFLGTITFFSRGAETYSRMVFFFSWLLSMMLIPAVRAWMRGKLVCRNKWGVPAIIFGTGAASSIMARNTRLRPRIGLKVVGIVSNSIAKGEAFESLPILGSMEDVESIAAAYPGSYAIVPEEPDQCANKDFVARLDRHFPRIIMLPNADALSKRWATARDIGGLVGLEMRQNLLDGNRLLVKRTLDFCAALCGIMVMSPFFLIMAIWIKLDSKGPVFFGHIRLGRDGRPIKVWKFRTMAQNSKELLERLLAEDEDSRREWEETQKLRNDPRVTGAGKFLRKTSLDELPQLWNVVCGDLSLVGPRPIVEDEKNRYKDSFALYSRIRPGITGLWQISGRNLTSYDERIDLDSYYARNWSIWFDIYILAKTIPVVLTGHGAF
jgi:Undecaprenyl-phosphate galactose phosphotransferase WbaP